MDLNNLEQGNNEQEQSNNFNKKSFLTGLLSGVIVLIAVCAIFPSVNSVLGNLNISFFDKDNGLTINSNSRREALRSEASGKISNEAVQKKIDEIFKVLDRNYVNRYDKEDTIEGIYAGLVYGIGDPYTVYMSAPTFEKFMEDTEGTYAGIGVSVSVDTTDNSIVVVSPFEGYPGAKAGMLPGDKILKVNDSDVSGDTLDVAISIMKGEPGTTVDVTVYRTSEKRMIDMTIMREKIDVPTVSHKMLENNIAYIRITQFDRVTFNQFKIAYDEVKDSMSGLIIDLRNNPGGLLKTVTDITDMLVPEGTIVYTEDKNGRKVYTKSDANHIEAPLLVLVNGYSASASEVLSGAVKDLGVGELVGAQTFGKGLVQNIYPLRDGSAIKVTIAKYYTPNGVCIQGEGIPPNYPVELDTKLSVKISSLTLDEDIQLSKAIEVMNRKIGAQ